MKPKDLKFPFVWNERKPVLSQRVLFVPQYYDQHGEWKFPGWNAPEFFGNNHPVHIEYCSGNGTWILDKALQNPDQNWVAVEKKFERVRKIWSKVQNYKVPNLMIISGEALTFTRYYLPENSITSIFVNFPDPWPKKKHSKNRLFQFPFPKEVSRVVKNEGSAILVTDDPAYSLQMCDEMQKQSEWQSAFLPPFFVTEWPDYGTSYFDRLWREKGREIRYMQFVNKK